MKKRVSGIISMLLMLIFTGCSSYQYRAAPVPLPSAQPGHADIDGVQITATAYLSPDYAKARFGFDIRKAGLLPVQVVMDNRSSKKVSIDPLQTFLIDNAGQAWPLLPEQEAYNRIKGHVNVGTAFKGTVKPAAMLGAAGALVGFAVGIVSGHNAGESAGKGAVLGATAGALAGGASAMANVEERIKEDLANRSLENKPIEPGALAHGFLFFPGKHEALSASSLRLALRIDGNEKIANVPLTVR